jgi:N-acetylglucosamine-6-phosphate deacetylase
MWAIRAAKIYTSDSVLEDAGILIDAGRIAQVSPWHDLNVPSTATVTDVRPQFIAAGFVDIHVHGAAGHDFMDGDDAAFEGVCQWHARGGTTSLLATTCAAPLEQLYAVLKRVRQWQAKSSADLCNGARVLGAHVEGPFFNMQMRGCHLPEYIKNPSEEDVAGLLEYSDVIRHITLAPEIDGALEAIEQFYGAGISVAVAHSDADSDHMQAALQRGLRHVTHLYNAMSFYHRRGPHRVSGVVETALVNDDLTVELIADGLHVNETRLKLAVRAKGVSRICLVTDAMRSAGMPDGLYAFGPRNGKVAVLHDHASTMPEGSGFASSVVPMIRCVQVMVQGAGVSLEEALTMASKNPARIVGAHRKGALREGMDADLVVLDNELKIQLTVVEGNVVFKSDCVTDSLLPG